MAGVEVLVLGPVALNGEIGLVTLPAMQQRLLAALLVAEGHVCQTDELLEVLWSGNPPPSARKLVQVYVSQLRKLLPPSVKIETVGGGYALHLPEHVVDARRFEGLVRECAAARRDGDNAALAASLAAQALSLWRGRAYGELAYEEFARGESERLEDLRLTALEEQLDAQLALGHHAAVLGDVLTLAGEHPFRERVHELTMLALYRCGRQSEALEHFTTVRERLNEELGLEPGPALRDLQRRILQHDTALEAGREPALEAASLPLPTTKLVGRERELEELRRLLSRRDVRLVVLTGAGGSGKTRLALEAARSAASSFANGAVLVELGPLRDPELVAPTIAQALGVAEVAGQTPIETLADALRGQELLLLLDNAEHLREAAPSYAELVARAPRLTLLVTSRAVLHVTGEQVFPVAPLDETAAVDLFEQRAQALVPTFRVTEESEPDVREICRRVDCLPLAVELAAARIPLLTPRVLLARLSERLKVLTAGPHDLPARQQTLRETLAWSANLLGDRERRVLARLAVFAGGATIDAAEAVCGADLDILGTLVDHNLVRRMDVSGEPRFGLLETIREYAYELLADDRATAQRELLAYLAAVYEPADLNAADQPLWNARIDADIDNLRAALDTAATHGELELELQLAGKLWRYWWVRGHLDEGIARIEGALARSGAVRSTTRARALHGAAGISWGRGDYDNAVRRAKEAIEVAQATGATHEEVAANTVLGIVANARKDFETARRHHERSIALARELGVDPGAQQLNLATVMLDSGDPEGAASLLEELLARQRRDGIAQGIGFAGINLGLARYRLRQVEAARDLFVEAERAFAQLGFRVHVAHALQGRAACEASLGRYDEAARLLGEAAHELGDAVYSEDEFPLLAAEIEATAREALGDAAFEAAREAGGRARPSIPPVLAPADRDFGRN